MFSGNRLKEKRIEKKFSQSALAERLNINKASYNKWESGKTVPNQKNLVALSDILGVSITYFESEYNIVNNFLQLSNLNKTLAEEYVEALLQSQKQDDDHKVVSLFTVEVLDDIKLSAGPGQGVYSEYATCTVYSDKEYSGYDIATWIKGNSMSPTYLDGEVALIRETGFDYNGAVYAFVWENRTYIKRLFREKDFLRVVSINSTENPDWYIRQDEDFHIVGKVIGHFMPVDYH